MTAYEDLKKGFELGPWQVLPDRGLLRNAEVEQHVEPLPMDVMVVLAARQGEVVGPELLVEEVWSGRPVTDEVITRCISVLRRALGDDARNPTFIETVQKRGYRLKEPVKLLHGPQDEVAEGNWKSGYLLPLLAGFAALILIISLAFFIRQPRPPGDAALRSVVVFPFECGGDDHLCFGFSAALTSTLYQVENLKVVKSREPFPASLSAEEAAESFGVDGVITGSVGLVGKQLLIAAELVDGRNGFVFWSNRYDGDEDAIFELQERLANDVMRSVRRDATGQLAARSRPASFAAFDRFAEGQYEFDKRSAESIHKAIGLFEQTIELDPNYGPAYLMAAYAYLLYTDYETGNRDEMFALATSLAERGIARDPDIRQPAQTLYGFMHHKRGEWTAASEAYRVALSGSTVFPITHQLYSRLLASTGRLQESLEHALLARELDPQSAILISRLAIAYFWVDDLENAEYYFERGIRTELEAPIHELTYSLMRIRQGRIDDARQLAKDSLQKYQLDDSWVDPVFDGIADPSLRPQARAIVARMAASGELHPRVEISLWAVLGDGERALSVARLLEQNGEVFEADLLFIEQFRVLREQPGFLPLMDAIGMTEHWRTVGCQWENGGLRCRKAESATL
ncbi:MAG: hypothetical protein BMS9Abin32_181 [Gammaproteobacteria bacterium]|nr:MAG: hypothetical protein BMS9Abin32_181 [Gammaproteobacteria bacterium]